ncbi:hypothetical protein ACFQ4C_11610 [Larkinella insperata]|uniref:Uncharacterized protein n=1 Tax=Larkinella insperata TaxID=332158 RepID=A0ABW3Q8P4_9BACT|nr:hypothetical protein [Larkinella insperata]
MATSTNSKRRSNELLNWGIVWGLIFFAIGLDIYINYNEHKQDKETYRSQYEAKAFEADSLRAVKSQLERELFEIKTLRNTEASSSLSGSAQTDKTTLVASGTSN